MPWRRERLPTPVFWPGEFHRQYIVHGVAELDTAEQLSLFKTIKPLEENKGKIVVTLG